MDAHLEHVWQAAEWRIWIAERRRGSRVVFQRDEGGWREVPIDDHAQLPEPTLTLSEGMLEALLAAAAENSGIAPPNTSQGRHLDDAVKTRDRLLTIIETRRSDANSRC